MGSYIKVEKRSSHFLGKATKSSSVYSILMTQITKSKSRLKSVSDQAIFFWDSQARNLTQWLYPESLSIGYVATYASIMAYENQKEISVKSFNQVIFSLSLLLCPASFLLRILSMDARIWGKKVLAKIGATIKHLNSYYLVKSNYQWLDRSSH